ncbi:MAG: Tol-Pal system beta propeller repeat protein TolB [Desulfobacterales bacterium]|nr:Tol-Pal system beta propeller repeat protein TolB [Desulfobacterales bacterium]
MGITTRMAPYAAAIVLTLLVLHPHGAAAVDEFIEIHPFLKKIPLAIPEFKPLDSEADTARTALDARELTAATLAFTSYFKLIDPAAFLDDPKTSGLTARSINFRNWTIIGAELLITGGVAQTGAAVELEMRLFDTVKGRSVIGKRYRGRQADLRKIVRKFCSEVIFYLTGDRGYFNSEIAFISTGTGNKEIYIAEFDGRNPAQFTRTKDITLSPAWSSGGSWLAYTAYPKDKPNLYIKHRRQQRGYEIANKGLNITPAWRPRPSADTDLDKKQLAATLSFTGDQEIYLLTGKGKIIKRLTKSWGSDVSPTWSPDGKRFAFVSNRSGNPQIYVKDLESGRVDRFTYQGRYNTQPSWSPKGDRIAYSGMEGGRNDIYVAGFDGRPPAQLTREAGNNESPSWSPDGSMIVFSSNREGRARIFVMTAFGTDQRRLLTLPGEQTNPQWSPNTGL